MSWRGFRRPEALAERPYRLLFAATVVTTLGDRMATVALAFAVLAFGTATDLGIVLAVRQVAAAAVLVAGGVLSDRLPRSRVLVGASLLQGLAQGGTAAAVLLGDPSVALIAGFGLLWGLGDGLVVPAETGLVPQTVAPDLLQEANALQGLSRSAVGIAGPAIGGAVVVAAGSGWALAADAASCFLCALLLVRLPLSSEPPRVAERFLEEMRQGWREFRSRDWLWPTSLLFGLSNLAFMFWFVLGPLVAKQQLGGAGAWAAILVTGGIGAVAGGVWAIRHRPGRPLGISIVWSGSVLFGFASLALGASTPVIAIASAVGGFGLSVHVALWYTVLQTEVPADARSRVISLDAFGSVVLTPVGSALAGPARNLLGTSGALWLATGAIAVCNLTMLALPSVWSITSGNETAELESSAPRASDASSPAPAQTPD